jgi:hypothetical protein
MERRRHAKERLTTILPMLAGPLRPVSAAPGAIRITPKK